MTRFIQVDYPVEHPGVARIERAAAFLRKAWQRTHEGTLVLAAVAAAAVVVVNQVVSTLTNGHLLAAWIIMWLVAFAALAFLTRPARRAAAGVALALARWRAGQAEAEAARQAREAALDDARVMADISRSMQVGGSRDLRYRYY